jgi:hypothetical protein
MQRRTLDAILSTVGLMLTIVLIVAGALLTWGYKFADDNVHDQLAAQKIFFPPAGSPALKSDQIGPFLNQYAGEQLTTGKQAQAWADHFIAVHLEEVAGGKTYAQVSSAAQADPTNVKLKAQADTLFRGETLRGLLLNAYAFWKLGQIAKWGAIASFVLAAIMFVLTLLGFRHLKVAPEEAEVRIQKPSQSNEPDGLDAPDRSSGSGEPSETDRATVT